MAIHQVLPDSGKFSDALTEATPTTLPGSWQSQGCWTDTDTVAPRTLSSSETTNTTWNDHREINNANANGRTLEPGAQRVLPYQHILQRNNSATNCLSQWQAYPAAGMEYGDKCYCGDEWYHWGAEHIALRFTNGRVTYSDIYLESTKSSRVWDRTTKLYARARESDVFCSAGLTLPDSGQEWSSDQRRRLVSGFDRVNGTNDWQENFNVNEVALQHRIDRRSAWEVVPVSYGHGQWFSLGRWWRTGKQWRTRTYLILPNPAGGRYVTLQRTDPLNLHPFLAVLPGGGVLVIYYNEAWILDEGGTIKQLPNVPGAVNNILGGKTYPLEGTAVLHPRHYLLPFTDPLTVMTCGGSIPGPAIALDNCVSITREVDNAHWVIERMPAKRVMTCMIALPDASFFILNGAQQNNRHSEERFWSAQALVWDMLVAIAIVPPGGSIGISSRRSPSIGTGEKSMFQFEKESTLASSYHSKRDTPGCNSCDWHAAVNFSSVNLLCETISVEESDEGDKFGINSLQAEHWWNTPINRLCVSRSQSARRRLVLSRSDTDAFMTYASIVPEFYRLETSL
ncbi:hypothetical protein BD410DRAFT_805257 [Rickenella mellea]|uniref:Glyoxal oxidase N-terminal domain-containing protein n=1 Tax=Rickenella mellea TaxID=50990 RepID=A0A4Y7PX58_9AGAM|nr:hypothetical protein BD410DRAFT_805257 [Rickenella mellea]